MQCLNIYLFVAAGEVGLELATHPHPTVYDRCFFVFIVAWGYTGGTKTRAGARVD